MCGIFGVINYHDIIGVEAEEMLKSISNRGPDGSGLYWKNDVCLGHARLSILDLSEKANQPFQSRDGKLVITYNGEIYNFKELRKEYLANELFETSSDTEVLLYIYKRFGNDCIHYLRGMFAFCVYDLEKKQAFLARDRLGIKPLYYYQKGEALIFASEIKAILASGLYQKRLRMRSVADYFINGNTVCPHTIFDEILELEPGHSIIFDRGHLKKQRYWSLQRNEGSSGLSSRDIHSQLREKLSAAVRSHLVSDVPVGLFLSGGIDSSTIAALVGIENLSDFHTFTVRFDVGDHDESASALAMARVIGSTHHELVVDYREALKNLPRLIQCHDEPFGDAANICIYSMAEFAQRYVKVVLCGDGGDEVFGGYPRYRGNLVASKLLPFPLRLRFSRLPARYQRIVRILGEKRLDRRYASWMLPFIGGLNGFYRFLKPEVFDSEVESDHFERYRMVFWETCGQDLVNRMLYTDLHLLLHNTYLKKIDRPTMAHGLEARVPMLDTELVEYAYNMPGSFKVSPWGLKIGLRKAISGLVPNRVLNAPKRGFRVPFESWLRTDLRTLAQELFFDPSFASHNIFYPSYVREAWESFLQRRGYFGHLLWYVLVFELWYKKYMH